MEVYNNPNYEHVPRDLCDLPVVKKMIADLQKEKFDIDIREELDENKLGLETKKCLENIRLFCKESSYAFRENFLFLLEKYQKERKILSPRIVDYLKGKKFDLPNFTVAHGDSADRLLEDFKLESEMDEKDLLLVFQLPKPLAQWWWKGGVDNWGSLAKSVHDEAIEWGHFYRELMVTIWETQGRFENESDLVFWRVNEAGQHDQKKYYYVWKMNERL